MSEGAGARTVRRAAEVLAAARPKTGGWHPPVEWLCELAGTWPPPAVQRTLLAAFVGVLASLGGLLGYGARRSV